jgi:hypothetical protein
VGGYDAALVLAKEAVASTLTRCAMLNQAEWFGPRILERPTCAYWKNALWVAYLDLAQQVTVARVEVGSAPLSLTPQTLGMTTPWAPAIAVLGDALVVAVSEPGGPVRLFASSDGTTFTPTFTTPFVAVGPPALAAAGSLWLAWMDDDRVLHVAEGHAYAVADKVTPVAASRPPAVAARDDLVDVPYVALAWRDASNGLVTLTTFPENKFDPALPNRVSLPETEIDHVAVAVAPGHAGAAARVVVACERFEPPRASSRDHKIFARQVSRDLAQTGGIEPMPHPGLGPGLASGAARVWATWRDMADRADHLVVAPYDIVFDLPPELHARINQPCDPGRCPPDPRLVCEATDRVDWQFEEAWIRNARKGDLVVTPASGSGMIGGFLKKLQYEQQFDHMGIMLEDHYTVRHATMAHKRADAFYVGSMLGEPAPTDGIRPDVLKYGWPGTITQSVHNAFMPWAGFNDGANPEWVDPTAPDPGPEPPASASDEERETYRKKRARVRGFVDPEQEEDGARVGYEFANLTWLPQLRPDGRVIEALVVRPPTMVEVNDPLVRPTLHRVAEAARTIRGHYRFYAYTQGMIATSSIMAGPPKGDPYWQDLPAGADWPAGTAPVVCSTFVWAAVRKASRLRLPQLSLEGAAEPTPEEQWRRQQVVIHDGLYRYHTEERREAGAALYANVSGKVRSQVWEKLMKLKDEIGWLVTALQWGAATLFALLAMPVAALASLIGIQLENAQALLLWLNDMPDDVGNQMCNTFASDQPENKDDALWKNTGEGVSVSPHDVVWLWDPPTVANARLRQGLWGDREPLILPAPRWERKRVHVFKRSRGLALVQGTVKHRLTDDLVPGALVRIGCESTLTNEEGFYRMEVAAGQREVIAGAYWPQSKWWLEGRELPRLTPGENPNVDLFLEDPPDWRRRLQIRIWIDLVHQVLIGKDDWRHETGLLQERLTKLPTEWGDPPGGAPSLVWDWHWSDKNAIITEYAGDERARLKIRATLLPETLAIKVELRGELIEGHDAEVEASADHTTEVAKDGTKTVNMSLKSGETPPDRAWLKIELLNLREIA